LIKFRSLTPQHRRAEEAKGFFDQAFIQEYLDSQWKSEVHNKKWFEILYGFYEKRELLDAAQVQKVARRLEAFKSAIEEVQRPFQALRFDFKKYPFEVALFPEDAREVVGWES